MHILKGHDELDEDKLLDFIRANPLGHFTTSVPHPTIATLQVSHVPFIVPTDDPGVLRAHMARANPQAKALVEAAKKSANGELEDDVLIIFNDPTHAYITPVWYRDTKPSTGKVVPTWDYRAVQVYGRVRVVHENTPETSAFLQEQMEQLTDEQEAGVGTSWKVTDAPDKYVELLKRAVIGLEITISRIEGRYKLSQDKPQGDWAGVVKGLEALGTKEGADFAKLVQQAGEEKGMQLP